MTGSHGAGHLSGMRRDPSASISTTSAVSLRLSRTSEGGAMTLPGLSGSSCATIRMPSSSMRSGRYMWVVVVMTTFFPAAASSRAHAKISEVLPPAPTILITACSGSLICRASVILFCFPLKFHNSIFVFYSYGICRSTRL